MKLFMSCALASMLIAPIAKGADDGQTRRRQKQQQMSSSCHSHRRNPYCWCDCVVARSYPSRVDASTGSSTTTDKDGRFRVPVIVSEPDKASKERYLVGTGFDVFADGFVRFQERLRVEERVVDAVDRPSVRDFVLMPGEEIEGIVSGEAFDGFLNQ